MSIDRLKEIIEGSNNIVFFGGAGTSTESNIPDFRSADSGIYNKKDKKYPYSPEIMINHTFFTSHPEEFFKFYRNEMVFRDARPNDAHIVLAELERMGKLKAIITQNIDGLHQKAGSKNVLELHGTIHRNYCINCGREYDLDYVLASEPLVPKCEKCGGIVRPDVVLYEEGLDMKVLNRAIKAIKKANVLIVGGTSLVVYPAAGLVEYFKGDELVLINKSPTRYDYRASVVINDSIGKVLREATRDIL
ncbi:MAG TPA: NAD-dependent protein deacylase [Clostridiales bacterium]|nr:NAD-dependent protein deacylase [Clostridiales bacterium]